jgi:DNA-directed RNA polymerase subunit RPC12/RpoP
MEVACGHCGAKLNIPDEKIPRDHAVRIACPKCGEKITVGPAAGSSGTKEGRAYDYSDYSDDEALGFYEEGTKLALVMIGGKAAPASVKAAVEELGYTYVETSNTRDAIGKMRFHHFDVIVLFEQFDGQGLDNSPILNYLNHIPMSVRRRMFVALVSDQFKTMDNMMAFAMSANTVISEKDLDKLAVILKKAVTENEKFYKVLMDALVETGKI